MSFQPPGPGPDPQQPPVPEPPAPEPPAPPMSRPDPREFGATMIDGPQAHPAGPGAMPPHPGAPTTPAPWLQKRWTGANVVLAWLVTVAAFSLAVTSARVLLLDLSARQMLETLEFEEADEVMAQSERLGIMFLLSIVALATVWAFWFHRVWVSDRSEPFEHRLSTSMAVGGWFIPLGNLVLGGRALTELWHGVASARVRDLGTNRPRRQPPLVTIWWVGWVLMFVTWSYSRTLQSSANQLARNSTDPDQILDAASSVVNAEIVQSAVWGVTALVLVAVVWNVMRLARR